MDLSTPEKTIETAFRDVERDEECTLHQAQLTDQGMRRDISDAELVAAKNEDPETDWRRVPAVFLDECNAALSHASPQSWRFYLPAYMRRALQLLDANIHESELLGSVIFHLTYRGKDPGMAGYILDRFHTLSAEQQHAVAAFLEYVRDYPAPETSHPYSQDAERALRKYWGLDKQKRPTGLRIILP